MVVSAELTHHDHSTIACSHHIYMGVILRARSVRGEPCIQRNACGEVATTAFPFYKEPHRSHVLCVKAAPDTTLHIVVTAPFCYDRKAREACVQSFALWQQATIEITWRDHSIIACSRHIYLGLFFAHIPFVVNRAFSAMPVERLQQHHFLLLCESHSKLGVTIYRIFVSAVALADTQVKIPLKHCFHQHASPACIVSTFYKLDVCSIPECCNWALVMWWISPCVNYYHKSSQCGKIKVC